MYKWEKNVNVATYQMVPSSKVSFSGVTLEIQSVVSKDCLTQEQSRIFGLVKIIVAIKLPVISEISFRCFM
jgi:hypothetical protein